MFGCVNYQFWKVIMKIFIESIDMGIWFVIINGPYVSIHVINIRFVNKPWADCSKIRNKKT